MEKDKEAQVKKPTAKKADSSDSGSIISDSDDDDSLMACCLCHCAVDYSDRDAFYKPEEEESTQKEDDEHSKDTPKPMLLPESLYDVQNALVLCDTCDRPYHQRCHFVPVLTLPRGDWHCLICKFSQDLKKKHHHHHEDPSKRRRKYTQKEISTQLYPELRDAAEEKEDNGKSAAATTETATNATAANLLNKSTPTATPLHTNDAALACDWEHDSRLLKAHTWKRTISNLQKALSTQLQHVRMAQTTLRAYTQTRRHSTESFLQSQELSQTLVKVTGAKYKIQSLLKSLEDYRVHDSESSRRDVLQDFLEEHPDQRPFWYPFGSHAECQRKPVPRLHEQEATTTTDTTATSEKGLPTEVQVVHGETDDAVSKAKEKHAKKASSRKAADSTPEPTNNDEDDDDLLSLDDLKCCVCYHDEATDENDLIICDGAKCFRAYHRLCLPHPVPTVDEIEDEDDWFCPICTSLSTLIANVQSEYYGDEWKQHEDDDTIQSWECVRDVFPNARLEYEMALKWKDGKEDEETIAFVTDLLGFEATREKENGKSNSDDSDDMESDEDDDDFDLEAFQNRDREVDEDASDASSEATLQDMEGVELNVGRSELNALSAGEEDSSDESDDASNDGQPKRRTRKRRRASRAASTASSSDGESSSSGKPDVGTLDESNIVEGKRRRNNVDYRRLNDSMFGDISDEKAVKLFDDRDDEFHFKISSKRRSSSSSSSGSTSSDDSDSDSSEDEAPPKRKNGTKTKRSAKSKRSNEASSEEEESDNDEAPQKRKNGTKTKRSTKSKRSNEASSEEEESDNDASATNSRRRRPSQKASRGKRSAAKKQSPQPTKRKNGVIQKRSARKIARESPAKNTRSSA